MHWRKRIPLVLIAGLIMAVVIYGFIPQPLKVDVAAVMRGSMEVIVEQEGKTRVMNRYVISAPVSGYLRRIEWEVGDAVILGNQITAVTPTLPVLLDPRQRAEAQHRLERSEAALQASEAQVQAAEAQAKLAKAELARVRSVNKKGFVAAESVDRAEATMREAEAALQAARFNVDVAHHEREAARVALRFSAGETDKTSTEEVSVLSPVAGNVLALLRKSEGPVAMGEPLVELGDASQLEVAVDVLSMDAVRIQPGQKVRFERWGGAVLEGRVRSVEPVGFTKVSALGVEEQRVLVIADIISPKAQWQALGDHYRVDAIFILWESNNVLQVPESALFRVGETWNVFVVEEERAHLRQVVLGHRAGLTVEVVNGLSEGEIVITHPSDQIEEGARISSR